MIDNDDHDDVLIVRMIISVCRILFRGYFGKST